MVLMKSLRKKDLIRESWSVSWPMTLVMFFIFIIGLADVYVAGRIGKEIQAAYGVTSQVYFIFSIIAFGLTVGTVSLISQLFTSGKKTEFVTAIDSSLTVSVVSGAVLTIAGVLSAHLLVLSMDVPEVLKGYAVPLMRIYSLGLVFAYILINTNGIMRACGKIKKSLITMAVVCLLNTFLNFYLAFRTPLGYQGIAVATVLSTFIGCLMNIFFLRSLLSGFFKFSAASVKKIINIGWPAGLLQIFWQLAAIALFLILAKLPKNNIEVMAAFTNGLKIESAIFLPAFAFNMANAVVVGNLLGKKDRENAFSAGLVTALLGVAVVSVLTLIIISNSRPIAAMLSNNPTVISESINYIRIALLFEPVMAWSVILAGALNGAGDTKSVMFIVTLCVWAVRVPLSYFLGLYFGLGASAVWWSMNLSIIAQAIFITRRYFSREWFHHSEKIIAY